MTPQPEPEKPEQGKFSKDETNFLKTYLPTYDALCHQLAGKGIGPKGRGLVKGQKKYWVVSKVFPEFVKEFSSDQNDGSQLQSLQTKIFRWFTNYSPLRNVSSGSTLLTTTTNGPGVFAEEHKRKITEDQSSGLQPLEFSIRDSFDATEWHPASPRREGIAELNNNTMVEIVSDHSERYCNPQLQDSLSSTPAATSLVVGLPFESPPSSESMVEVAIRNVACAGYLRIIHDHATAINDADQTSSQLEGVNSKKRTQKEMEQEGSCKEIKKPKIAVPAREQSLRIKDSKYKNKNVTVRLR